MAASSVKVLKVSLRSEACGDTKEEESCDGVCTDCEYEEMSRRLLPLLFSGITM